MFYQERGGNKTAKKAIGIGVPINIKRDPMQTLKNKTPTDLLAKGDKRYYLLTLRGKQFLIFRNRKKRKNKRRRQRGAGTALVKKSSRTKFLYFLAKAIHFKPRWEMEKTVEKVYMNRFINEFKKKIHGSF
jgi:hypothetical protein